jgi:ABC-type arginine transport system ATPase subunit
MPPVLIARSAVGSGGEWRFAHDFARGTTQRLHCVDRALLSKIWRALGLLDPLSSGEIEVAGISASGLGDRELISFRSRHFGYIFEEPFLLEAFSPIENVAMPLFRIAHATPEQAREETFWVFEKLGITDLVHDPVRQFTEREKHLLSAARALVHRPDVLMIERGDLPDLERVCAAALELGATPIIACATAPEIGLGEIVEIDPVATLLHCA